MPRKNTPVTSNTKLIPFLINEYGGVKFALDMAGSAIDLLRR